MNQVKSRYHELDANRHPLDHPSLLMASAGTGKTFTIALLYLRLLVEAKRSVSDILVVTFTNAATAELKKRIRERIVEAMQYVKSGNREEMGVDEPLRSLVAHWEQELQIEQSNILEALDAAVLSFDEAAISTIHGYCNRMLLENAFESGASFDKELLSDTKDLIEEIAADEWIRLLWTASPVLVEVMAKMVNNDIFAGLAKLASQLPDAPVLPVLEDGEKEVDFETCEKTFLEAYNEARNIWQKERQTIREFFSDAGKSKYGFNRTIYNDKVPEHMDGFEHFFSPEIPSISEFVDTFKKYFYTNLKMNKNYAKPEHAFFHAIENLAFAIEKFEKEVQSFATQKKLEFLDEAKTLIEEYKRRENILTYDDMLILLARSLHRPSNDKSLEQAMLRSHPVALIDEFQDTDSIQYKVFGKVYAEKKKPLILIGDPKQSIYRFRGADIFEFLQAMEDTKGHIYTMDTNYRSDHALIEAVNRFFMAIDNPFYDKEIPFEPVNARPNAPKISLFQKGKPCAPFRFQIFQTKDDGRIAKGGDGIKTSTWLDDRVPRFVAYDVLHLLLAENGYTLADEEGETRPVRPQDIAILVTKNRYGLELKKELGKLGIPAVTSGAENVFASPEAIELFRFLEGVALRTPPKIKAAMATAMLSRDAHEIIRSGNDERLWELWVQRFYHWKTLWDEEGFMPMFQRVMAFTPEEEETRLSLRAELLQRPNGERSVTNYQHLAELLNKISLTSRFTPKGQLRWLEKKIADAVKDEEENKNPYGKKKGDKRKAAADDSMAPDEAEVRLESDEAAVKILTIHKAKGLEFPIVFHPYLYKYPAPKSENDPHEMTVTSAPAYCKFHDIDDGNIVKIDVGHDEATMMHAAWGNHEKDVEILRNLYVSLTRARHANFFYWGRINGREEKIPYAFIEALAAKANPSVQAEKAKAIEEDKAAAAESKLHDETLEKVRAIVQSDREHFDYALVLEEPDGEYAQKKASNLLVFNAPTRRFPYRPTETSFSTMSKSASGTDDDDWQEEEIWGETKDYEQEAEVMEQERELLPLDGASLPEGIDTQAPCLLQKLHGGTKTGSFLHEIMEFADFQAAKEDRAFQALLDEKLGKWHFDEKWKAPIADAFEQWVACPLDERVQGLALKNIPMEKRLNELDFSLRMKKPDKKKKGSMLKERFEQAFKRHAKDDALKHYGEYFRSRRIQNMDGYLIGTIDLVFEHEGKFYVVDYKTNWLGDKLIDYHEKAIFEAMEHHHYILQYHLYTLALHQFLTLRKKDYDYEKDIGGVYYLFLRGMREQAGGHLGVYRDRPSRELIEALSLALNPKE